LKQKIDLIQFSSKLDLKGLFFISLPCGSNLNPNINHRTAFCRQSLPDMVYRDKKQWRIVLKGTAATVF
jgi:hypothetical protein